MTFTFTITAAARARRPIAEIQGTGATTPLDGQTVTTQGVVTASYPTGGLNGFYIQTPGADTRQRLGRDLRLRRHHRLHQLPGRR